MVSCRATASIIANSHEASRLLFGVLGLRGTKIRKIETCLDMRGGLGVSLWIGEGTRRYHLEYSIRLGSESYEHGG